MNDFNVYICLRWTFKLKNYFYAPIDSLVRESFKNYFKRKNMVKNQMGSETQKKYSLHPIKHTLYLDIAKLR
jgi:hypothetical protein